MNLSRLWAQQPGLQQAVQAVLDQAVEAAGLTLRTRGILVTACASTIGDSYCALAWGKKLAGAAGADLAATVLRGGELDDPAEQALAVWARRVAGDPNGIVAADVQELRDAGYDDRQVFAVTLFVAMRIAFSTVNDALGALPDRELVDAVPDAVRDAVTFGRSPDRPPDRP